MNLELIKTLHQTYVRESGMEYPWSQSAIFVWQSWLTHGWTQADLELTIRFMRKKARTVPKQFAPSLRFCRIIQDDTYFADYFSQARAAARIPARTGRDRVLESTGRETPKLQEKTAGQILASSNAFEAFRQWRKETGI